jgi:hypothetical protein
VIGEPARGQRGLVFSMKEVMIMVVQFLILSIFVAVMVFYGFVFWHWRNDGKRGDVRRENSPNPVAKAFGS